MAGEYIITVEEPTEEDFPNLRGRLMPEQCIRFLLEKRDEINGPEGYTLVVAVLGRLLHIRADSTVESVMAEYRRYKDPPTIEQRLTPSLRVTHIDPLIIEISCMNECLRYDPDCFYQAVKDLGELFPDVKFQIVQSPLSRYYWAIETK